MAQRFGSNALRTLITGSCGQLGSELARSLRSLYGAESVVCTDVRKPSADMRNSGPFEYLDVMDGGRLAQLIVKHDVNCVVHFAALLSAAGERNPDLAITLNVEGTNTVFKTSRAHSCRLFVPSTIGAFGPSSPKDATPDVTIQRPTSIYGVSKVYLELLGDFYARRFSVDFRCLRYPGIISADTEPGGGTTDYAVDIYHNALRKHTYECYLRPDSALPMMYIDDCIGATVQMLTAPRHRLKQNVYNINAMSFTPEQVAAAIRRHIPDFTITYKVDPVRQAIADSWPRSLGDDAARNDWGWDPKFDLNRMTDLMLDKIRQHSMAEAE